MSRITNYIRAAGCALLVQIFALFVPAISRGEGLTGFLEYTYGNSDSTTKDTSGTSMKSNSSSFLQRYYLSLDRTLWPSLRFNAGGNVEFNKSDTDTTTDTLSSHMTSKDTKFFPYMNLTLNNALGMAGIGYSRRQETLESSGTPSSTTINDNYTAQVSMRPEGLPSVDLFASRFNNYDGDRQFVNIVNDSLMLNTKYSPIKSLDLNYQWIYNDMQDKLKNLENQSYSNSGRVAFNDHFFDNRLSVYSSYNIASQSTETISKGVGDVTNQQYPIHGYFKISQFPDTAENGTLDQYDSLIAGNASINIGTPPFGVSDMKVRNIGLEFGPGITVNTFRLLVNQNLGNLYTNFKWSVYTSSDQGKTWQLLQSLGPESVSFGYFVGTSGTAGYAFQLKIPQTSASLVKVTTTPLELVGAAPPGIDASNILITKMEAYDSGPAPTGVRKSSTLSGHYDMSTRMKILELPKIYYDMNFTFDHASSDISSSQRYAVTNSLSLAHSFSPIYSVGARVSREDGSDSNGSRSANVYSASLTATPLPALSHSLVFSGRNETAAGQTTSSYSLFANNSAEVYRGVNLSLNGGASRSYAATGRQSDDLLFLFGASLLPHPKVTINATVNGRKEWQTGGNQPETTDYKQDSEISVSLNPFRAVYFFGSVVITTETGRNTIINRNLGGSWAPFRDGNLLLNLAYSETATSDENSQQTRSLVQSLRWYFRRSSYLDVSYLIATNSSITQSIDTYSLNASLRFTF